MNYSRIVFHCSRTCMALLVAFLTGTNFSAVAARPMKMAPAPAPEADGGEETATIVRSGGVKGEPTEAQTLEVEAEPQGTRKNMAWLGIVTEEATEVLNAQLGLDPGVGLIVTFVSPDSPAAKAGLRKHDVLVQFDNQSLVHPAQLRKLVQSRADRDEVKLTYYRAGKKDTVTVTLGKRAAGYSFQDVHELKEQLREFPIKDALHEQMNVLRKELGKIKIDHEQVRSDLRDSMKEANKAVHDAMQSLSKVDLGPARRALEELVRSGLSFDHDATVTVRSTEESNKSVVKADDTGTLVIVANPKLRLTAHDKEGKLLFDGQIQTQEDRAKVPKEVWERAAPLLKKMDAGEVEEGAEKDPQ